MAPRSKYTTETAWRWAKEMGLPQDPDLIEQMRVGMAVEHEHADLAENDERVYAMITAAHLREDWLYYMPLLALERFRDRQAQAPKVQVMVDQSAAGEASLALGVQGVSMPLWSSPMPIGQAKAVKAFLDAYPALAVVYAWMLLTEQSRS